jgi:hypothetical protein
MQYPCRGDDRARSHCRFVLQTARPLYTTSAGTYLVPLFLKRHCGRTPGDEHRPVAIVAGILWLIYAIGFPAYVGCVYYPPSAILHCHSTLSFCTVVGWHWLSLLRDSHSHPAAIAVMVGQTAVRLLPAVRLDISGPLSRKRSAFSSQAL